MAGDVESTTSRGETTQIMVRRTPDLKQRIADQIMLLYDPTSYRYCRKAHQVLNRTNAVKIIKAFDLELKEPPEGLYIVIV